ncbi:peptidase M24 [Syntrophobotulus glycolicus DSM 8271]|uniref:Peptidase M24 n=1 Tax=Syntrophobotulus glycolicus (strain DSM 8271 / FlGlyR) TaxID=645991 RepID=F0T0S6_SYNGF|nr:Xaa-Pro peptidase family protein [Syntrophobotulus glycolicus]ADY56215.1 peptidase M24 [Syntrophobotulus glycolicus DSM 8271]
MKRINELRKIMAEGQIDGQIVHSPVNIFYLSGFTGTTATLYITQDAAYLFTDFRYLEQASEEAAGFEVIPVRKNSLDILAGYFAGADKIGFEEQFVTVSYFQKLLELKSKESFIPCSDSLAELRQTKDEKEISLITEAVKIADQALFKTIPRIKEGVSEQEIAVHLEFEMRKAGASGTSFDFIVASGPRSAMPHGRASEKKIAKGEIVLLDIGAKYQGYCSDLTRTFFCGEPDQKFRDLYQIVLEAQQAAIRAIKPGIQGKEIDAVARKIIAEAGYGEFFGHDLGHSVGLDIHEKPGFGSKEETRLEPGMVITVEPGIYLQGWGGIRIEDMVQVTKNGVKVLTQSPKQFIISD